MSMFLRTPVFPKVTHQMTWSHPGNSKALIPPFAPPKWLSWRSDHRPQRRRRSSRGGSWQVARPSLWDVRWSRPWQLCGFFSGRTKAEVGKGKLCVGRETVAKGKEAAKAEIKTESTPGNLHFLYLWRLKCPQTRLSQHEVERPRNVRCLMMVEGKVLVPCFERMDPKEMKGTSLIHPNKSLK